MNGQQHLSFIGIGAQKCASTWVYKILQDHPQVCVSDPKELNFFSYKYDHGFRWYLNHFNDGLETKKCGEISPSYFYDPLAPARAHQFNPGMKIIVTLRDPVARAYSNHLHEIRIGQYQCEDLSFETGLKNNPMYVYQSLYARHLKKWLEYFDKSQMLILIQEEIKAQPRKHAKKLAEFLGISDEHESQSINRQANVSYAEKIRGMDSLLKSVGKFGRKLGLGALVNKIRDNSLVRNLRESNRKHLSEDVPPMKPETCKELENIFQDEVNELLKIMGRDSLPWTTGR